MAALRTIGILLLGMASALPSVAQTVSTTRTDYPSMSGARGITVADLNRDGWLDIITAHNDPDGIEVLTNRGAAGGYTKWFISLGAGPFDVASGDLNKDGFPDLAVADADGNNITVLFGMAGGFQQITAFGAVGKPRGLTIADVDRDGNPDIVYTAYENNAVQILYGDGIGHFAVRAIPILVGVNPQGVASADFNRDGWPDLVVASTGSVGLSILYQNSSAPGTFARTDLNVPPSQNVVTVADFNRDGRPDIAAASTGTSDVTVFLNGANFTSTLVYPSGGSSTRGIAAADLNRDGAPEIVTANRGTNTVDILPNNGDGTFGTAHGFAAGTGSRAVAVGDFNNDGRIDIASGNAYAATATILTNTTTFPQAAYAFSRTVVGQQPNGFGTSAADVADFDGDGKNDVLTRGASGGLIAILGSGAVTPIPTQALVDAAWAADVNEDGKPDVVAIDEPANTADPSRIAVFLGDGAGHFSAPIATPTTLFVHNDSGLRLGDVNRDGRLDAVVMAATAWDSPQSRVQIWAGRNDGTFTLSSTLDSSGDSELWLADVDNDGDLDVVSTVSAVNSQNGATSVIWWTNDGHGQFGSTIRAAAIADWTDIRGLDFGDVNHDGRIDIVAGGDSRTKGIAVLLGTDSGFGAPQYVAADNIFAVYVADITMDGNLDVVSETGEIYPGHGDGTFGQPALFDFFAPDLRILDFDKNGLPDIISEYEMGTAQLILNQHRDTNEPPAVTMGADMTIPYDGQFGEEETDIPIVASDPDLHRLTFSVVDENGKLVQPPSTDNYFRLPVNLPGTYTYTIIADDGRGGTAQDTWSVTVLPEKEMVIYTAPQAYVFSGNKWSAIADASAAAGAAVHDRNDGAPKVTAPLSAPPSYAEVSFVADPTQTYKLWVRLKADDNYWGNDSLYLQFSNTPYAPSTTSGIAINLEECSGCGDSGWGWRDESWGQKGVMGTLTLHFTRGGWQTLRIQTREDGVSVDQIVLSAEKYRTTRPGTVKNDTTILPRTPF